MTKEITGQIPAAYTHIAEATLASGFTMASDILTCSLLRTLAAAKAGGSFLELGTGTGLSTAWILDGMDKSSSLISIDNDPVFLKIANKFLGHDKRLNLINVDGCEWIENNLYQKFDYIFADTWHGKYFMPDDVLAMLNKGGLYIIDDMLPQSNWPDGHDTKAKNLVSYLEMREDLYLTKMVWATGIIIGVKK